MQNHLKTAREYGVQKALEAVGYRSADELTKEAEAIGLVEAPKTATQNVLESLFQKK